MDFCAMRMSTSRERLDAPLANTHQRSMHQASRAKGRLLARSASNPPAAADDTLIRKATAAARSAEIGGGRCLSDASDFGLGATVASALARSDACAARVPASSASWSLRRGVSLCHIRGEFQKHKEG